MQTHTTDGVLVAELDDGKANALSMQVVEDLLGALDDAERAANPVVIAGRPGTFCAGYDLEVVRSGDPERISALLAAGRGLYRRILATPVPVVAACTGHALAAGALLVLVADLRFALDGAWRIGLNEVRIGLALPEFGVTVGSHRLSPAHVTRAVVLGEVVGPAEARTFGFVDHVVDDDVVAAAVAAARDLADVSPDALGTTKARRNARLLAEVDALTDL